MARHAARFASDLFALTKPGVTRMCLLTTGGGIVLAPGEADVGATFAALVGVAMAVGGANSFNMWMERDTDRLMARTRWRPLPAGRLEPSTALRLAWAMSLAAVAILGAFTNPLTVGLAALAIFAYATIYTPLKYKTPASLIVGAVPGAAPPLLGWTAMTGTLDPGGLVLFGILLVWQIPHFIAVALYRKLEYERAGIRTVPTVRGEAVAKIQAVAWSMVLVPLSMLLTPLGVAGGFYGAGALLLGSGFLAWSFTGLDNDAGPRWARGFFLASLVYLPALTLVLALDAML